MSVLIIPCPECGSELKLRDRKLLGRKGICPKCQASFVLAEPEAVQLELAEPPVVGTGAKWVPDVPDTTSPAAVNVAPGVRFAAAPGSVGGSGSAANLAATGAVPANAVPNEPVNPFAVLASETSTPVTQNAVPRKSTPSSPVLAAALSDPELTSPTGAAVVGNGVVGNAVGTTSPRRTSGRAARRKNGWLPLVIGGVLLLVAGGIGVAFVPNGNGKPAKPTTNSTGKSTKTEGMATAQPKVELPPAPTKGAPITLDLVPDGTRLLIHVRPSQLWADNDQAAELRACAGPLATYLEGQLKERCRFGPQQVDEALFCFLPNERGTLPDIVTVARLSKDLKRSEFIELFGGQTMREAGQSITLSESSAVLQKDPRTLVIAPASLATQLAQGVLAPGATSLGIEKLLEQTDRDRHLTVVLEPDQLRLDAETLLPATALPLLERFLNWLGADAEAIAWNLHFGADQLYSQLSVRNKTSVMNQQTYQYRFQEQLQALPQEILAGVSRMNPRQMGKRKLIGRVPAMTQAFALSTKLSNQPRRVELVTTLPERAAPNLVLGALLAWDESTRTDYTQPVLVAGAGAGGGVPSNIPVAIADRLKLKIDIDFRRTPLQEAFDYIGGEIKTTVEIDGDALKLSAYTKNMVQDLQVLQMPAEQVLADLFVKYDQMCIVVDEENKKIILTTKPVAQDTALTPYPLPKPNTSK